ncbi:DUF4249 domain-containing protein [Tenacibaculum amylolyticum]|uniref:DUF4249 domain-containing protein n=1 Tax=Tenacibaculum amylolyticum TaxID=104269 RepID=UPI0038930C13
MKHLKFYTYILIIILLQSCIEPFDFTSTAVDKNLVVRAILTNELKNHTIELSNTIPIDSTEAVPEENATITITDNLGNIYNFNDTGSGVYISTVQFAAVPNTSYTLNIQTQDGRAYSSTPETLPQASQIDDITATVENNNLNVPIISFKASGKGNNPEGSYYRYEYDETYKIKTETWSSKKINVISATSPYQFELVEKDPDIYGIGFCYPTQKSKKILLTETKTLSSDEVSNFTVREIPQDSYLVGIRYSILLRQYVLNRNTYEFYTLLNTFSDPNDIFSQTQVGNIASNISSNSAPNEDRVIGFFDVSSVVSKRVFFNRADITTTGFINYLGLGTCNDFPQPFVEFFGTSPLLDLLNTNYIFHSQPPTGIGSPPAGPYMLVLRPCGDCSHLGSVKQPSFWID